MNTNMNTYAGTTTYGGYPNAAYGYGNVNMPPKKTNQPLTDEQIQYLNENSGKFNLEITLEQKYKSMCTHRDKNGDMKLTQLPDGRFHCNICHSEFKIVDLVPEEIDSLIDRVTDVLQTVKLMWLDAPRQVLVEYFLIIELLQKLKTIYRRATSNFSMYEDQVDNAGNGMMNPAFGGMNGLYSMMGANPFAIYGMYPQPQMYAYPQPAPQQPVVDPAYAQTQQPYQYAAPQQPFYGNPFAYNAAPVPGAVPTTPTAPAPAPAPAPQAPAVAPVPTAPTAPAQTAPQGEVQQTQVFNV